MQMLGIWKWFSYCQQQDKCFIQLLNTVLKSESISFLMRDVYLFKLSSVMGYLNIGDLCPRIIVGPKNRVGPYHSMTRA